MKIQILSILITSLALIGSAKSEPVSSKDYSKLILGSWIWSNHRHDTTITFDANGSYKQEGDYPDKGTWEVKNDLLLKNPVNREPFSSKIVFQDKNHLTLDGFLNYVRASK
jgi:hypothetical protein